MAKDTYLLQGNTKVRMEDLPPEAWRLITGGDNESDAQNRYSTVAVLNAAINARADAASSIPFRIESKRGKVVESSDDWNGGMGFLPKPKTIIRQLFMATDFTNQCYAKILKNRFGVVKGLQYFIPSTVTPKWDENGNLLHFIRTIKGQELPPITPDEMFYHFIQDAFVEVGASKNTPIRAALAGANVLWALDTFVQSYFENGAIDPVIAAIPRNTDKDERERIQGILNGAITGIKNAFKIFVASSDDVKLTQPLRNGLDSLKKTELTKEQRESIGFALRVPITFLTADGYTFATATQTEKSFIRWGIQPRHEGLFEALSYLLYEPLGYKLKPDYDGLEAFQQEEVERSSALGAFMSAVNNARSKEQLQSAMTIMGYDFTPEQVDALYPKEKEPERPVEATPQEVVVSEDSPEIVKALVELSRWQKKSVHNGKLATWHTLIIPENIRSHIINSTDWTKAFDEARQMLTQPQNDIKALAESINKLADVKPKEQVTIKADNITVSNPEALEAIKTMAGALSGFSQPVIVNVEPTPVQVQAATVQNIVNVEPTPITVENKVNVEPAPVKNEIHTEAKPRSARIRYDAKGKPIGAE